VVQSTVPTPCAQSDYNLSLQCLPCSECAECDPASDIPEGETCLNFPDTFNGGCSGGAVYTSPVHCGDAICGTLSSDFTNLDRDVYSITTTTYDSLIWCVEFDRFAASVQIVQPVGGGCAGTVTLAQNITYGGCETVCAQACLPPGTYWLIIQAAQYGINCGTYVAHLNCLPCDSSCALCPMAGIPENEPCPNIPDNYNGGCYWGPPSAMPVSCGDIICGTATSYDFPDHDFYQLTLNQRDSVIWCVRAEYPVEVDIYNPVANCANLVPIVQNIGPACTIVCASVCLNPGTYWLHTMPATNLFNQCKRYVARVQCTACAPYDTCNYASADFEPQNNVCPAPVPPILSCGDTLCGEINPYGDVDWYAINIPNFGSCVSLNIDVFANSTPGWFPYGQGLNPQLWVYQTDCATVVAYDNDGGVGTDSYLTTPCLQPGVYYIKIDGLGVAGQVTRGPYILAISCNSCLCDTCPYPNADLEPINDQCQPSPIAVTCGDTLCGDIGPVGANDVDWYSLFVPSPSCTQVTIDVFGNDTPGWYPSNKGLDPRVSLWASDCSTILGFDDSSGVGNDATMSSPCLQPGFYFIRIEGMGGTTGPYILAISCASCVCPCDVVCPPNVPGDGEACPNLSGPDTYNGGCASILPPIFGTMLCNHDFCGTEFAMGGIKDTDWFQLILTQPRRIQWRVRAEYPFEMNIFRPNPDCSNLLTIRHVTGNPCDVKQAFVGCLAAGTYYFEIAPTVTTGVPCSDYVSRLRCGKCFIHGVVTKLELNNNTAQLRLTWPADETQPVYLVYRAPTPAVEPIDANRIGMTSDTTFIDDTILQNPGGRAFYTITMQDPDSSQGGGN